MNDATKKIAPNAEQVQHEYDSTRGDLLTSNSSWFFAAGQQPGWPTPDARQVAFYAGMQCEELSEKLAIIFGPKAKVVDYLKGTGEALKRGDFDAKVADALVNDPKGLLDGDIDLQWVTVGSVRAQGADHAGATAEVDRANWDKRFPDGTFHLNEVGKVLKPEGWREPDLTPFVHPSLKK